MFRQKKEDNFIEKILKNPGKIVKSQTYNFHNVKIDSVPIENPYQPIDYSANLKLKIPDVPKYIKVDGVLKRNPAFISQIPKQVLEQPKYIFVDHIMVKNPINILWNNVESKGLLAHFIHNQIPKNLTYLILGYVDVGLKFKKIRYKDLENFFESKKLAALKLDVELEFKGYHKNPTLLFSSSLVKKCQAALSEAEIKKFIENEVKDSTQGAPYKEFTRSYLRKMG
ncbi:MAG TPA: hypothetical protein VHM20_04060 [Gammaproteobacteria bacterium]|jgi:hypothetical protein|nr:hypothetical protein [Gammaproteobacteria bacterium]